MSREPELTGTSLREFGTFRVESGQVRVSDPCYCPSPRPGYGGALKHGDGILLLPALNGRWYLMGEMVNDGIFGRRVGSLMAFHESLLGQLPLGERIGSVCVDSGQMAVVDEAHFPREPEQYEYNNEDSFYKRICNLTWSDDTGEPLFGGCLANAGVTSSGLGDGEYPAYAYQDGTGLTVAITVEFMVNEDEDEEDDFYDDDDDEESEEDEDDDDDEDEPDEGEEN